MQQPQKKKSISVKLLAGLISGLLATAVVSGLVAIIIRIWRYIANA